MSRENVELVRFGYEAYDRGDVDAALETFDPEVEWKQVEQPTALRGREGVRQAWDEWSEPFQDDLHASVEELIDAGETVIAVVRHRGTGKQSGVRLDLCTYLVYTVRNGKIARMIEYTERADALEAAGVRA
jgi:ketosteroid isomerase-like protein